MSQLPLILASGSPQRKQLMSGAGYAFTVEPPHESAETGICSQCGPAELVLDLAVRKAIDVVTRLRAHRGLAEPALLIACDTVAECEGTILGKPNDEAHARSMLEHLRGKRHRVYSGLCLWRLNGDAKTAPRTRLAVTELQMDNLSDGEIDEYIDSDMWRGKAGAFGYQDRPGWLRIVAGSESNVIGLPMELLAEMIAETSIE
jgi:septum formation protein